MSLSFILAGREWEVLEWEVPLLGDEFQDDLVLNTPPPSKAQRAAKRTKPRMGMTKTQRRNQRKHAQRARAKEFNDDINDDQNDIAGDADINAQSYEQEDEFHDDMSAR